ncbi:hypothetical protein KUTeg_012104 [Tegillarca granosa]|uniref:Uncharacterized protein n=1 Tax=Tegillarca granosa TaxID=220873 RepID=A0ABQ9EYK1_TEGGR|nr:hypothetical protein KUTeg_012104 [Tegillarca granosa]
MELSQFQDLVKGAKTPITPHALEILKRFDRNKSDANLLVDGFTNGFKLNYHGPRVAKDCQNLRSVRNFQALSLVSKEINLKRIAGLFSSRPFLNLRLSPVASS